MARFVNTMIVRKGTSSGYDVEVTDNADGTESYNIVTGGAGKPISVQSIEGLDVPSNYGKVYLYDNKLYYVHA